MQSNLGKVSYDNKVIGNKTKDNKQAGNKQKTDASASQKGKISGNQTKVPLRTQNSPESSPNQPENNTVVSKEKDRQRRLKVAYGESVISMTNRRLNGK